MGTNNKLIIFTTDMDQDDLAKGLRRLGGQIDLVWSEWPLAVHDTLVQVICGDQGLSRRMSKSNAEKTLNEYCEKYCFEKLA